MSDSYENPDRETEKPALDPSRGGFDTYGEARAGIGPTSPDEDFGGSDSEADGALVGPNAHRDRTDEASGDGSRRAPEGNEGDQTQGS
jgi:hypothetical protein